MNKYELLNPMQQEAVYHTCLLYASDKAYALRRIQGQGGYCDDDDSHILAEEVTEFFQCVHNKSPFKFVGMGREELRKNSAGGILRLQQKNLCLH